MLDIKLIRKDLQGVEAKLKTKIENIDLSPIFKLDETIRHLQTKVEKLKGERNDISQKIGENKQRGKKNTSLLPKVKKISQEIEQLDIELNKLNDERTKKLSLLPNIPMEDVPISKNPKDNLCLKTQGEKKEFSFPIKNHLQLGRALKLFDFNYGSKVTGSGWNIYTDMGAKLEWALINYMLDIHRKNGFIHIIPPLLTKEEIMFGSAQLPKFEDQLYKINDSPLYLIPTSEVVLNGLHYDEILDEEDLPLKYVAYTPCFRREAGAAGKQERGLIRTHQFNKVELFCFTSPEDSEKIFQEILVSAEEVLQGLNLHYRIMLLVSGEISFAAAKTVDIEVFLPGQNRYYEVSSISNCTDFQARRSLIRFKRKGAKPQLVHTLNGSGVATSRLMVALLENNQQEDGSVLIPEVLQKYLALEIRKIQPHYDN